MQDEQSTVRCENASPFTSPHWGEVAKRSERERGIKRCQYQSVSFPLTRLSRFARSAPSPRRGEGNTEQRIATLKCCLVIASAIEAIQF